MYKIVKYLTVHQMISSIKPHGFKHSLKIITQSLVIEFKQVKSEIFHGTKRTFYSSNFTFVTQIIIKCFLILFFWNFMIRLLKPDFSDR